MKMLKLPEDIESVCLGSGCPNNCWFCHEPKEIKYHGATFTKDKVYLYDMNILAYPEPYKLIIKLGESKRYFELSSGIDYRRLDLPIACLLRKYRFGRFKKRTGKWERYIRIAWDGSMDLQYKILDAVEMLKTAGFKSNQIGIFMLVNGKINFWESMEKLDTIKYWGCQVSDCCYDGGYPESEDDYLNNPRFDKKRFWNYQEIKYFKSRCRKHDQKVRRNGIDVEWKTKNKEQTTLIT